MEQRSAELRSHAVHAGRWTVRSETADSAAWGWVAERWAAVLCEGELPVQVLGDGRPVKNDLAGVSGTHGVESFFELIPAEAVSNDLADIEPGLQHDGHLVPGLIHFATVDSADGVLVEDYFCPVDGHLGR